MENDPSYSYASYCASKEEALRCRLGHISLPVQNAAMDYYKNAVDILTNSKHSRWVTDCLLLGETVLCALIIWKVSCKQMNVNASPPSQLAVSICHPAYHN